MEKKIISLKNNTIEKAFKKEVRVSFKHLGEIHENVEGSQFDSFYSLMGYLERAVSVFAYESNIFKELSVQEKDETYFFFNGVLYSIKKMQAFTEIYKPNDFLNQCTQEEESHFHKFIDQFINEWPRELEKHHNMVLETYLTSESANDREERTNVISAFKNLDFYFKSMTKNLPK